LAESLSPHRREKRTGLALRLDATRLRELIERTYPVQPTSASRLLYSIAGYDLPLALQVSDRIAPTLAQVLNRSPAAGFYAIEDVLWWILGFAPRFLSRRAPSREGRRIGRRVASLVDAGIVAEALASNRRRDWQALSELMFFLTAARAASSRAVLEALDLDRLDNSTAGLWVTIPHELEQLLSALAVGEDYEPARSLIVRHGAELTHLSARITVFAPEVAATRLRDGLELRLGIEHGFEWNVAALALDALHRIDARLPQVVIEQNRLAIAAGLSNIQKGEVRGAGHVLAMIENVAPEELGRVAGQLDVERAEKAWTGILRTGGVNRRVMISIVGLLGMFEGPGSDLRDRLAPRFPSLRARHPT
jgi:hypothetical protein